ncbi:hypothetical protein NQZ68_012492, partial [Dissostichus eleginoides]
QQQAAAHEASDEHDTELQRFFKNITSENHTSSGLLWPGSPPLCHQTRWKHCGETFLVPLHHHRGFRRNARRKKSDMARVVVEGMQETTAGGGGMLNRRKSKARRRKRKELFAIQMCFAGVMLGLVVGLKSVAQKAEIHSYSKQRQLMGWI